MVPHQPDDSPLDRAVASEYSAARDDVIDPSGSAVHDLAERRLRRGTPLRDFGARSVVRERVRATICRMSRGVPARRRQLARVHDEGLQPVAGQLLEGLPDVLAQLTNERA
jgi:hypothetical protein